ncbi:MAG: hypothetical protein M1819_002735 [Sarea resinae]|nr:MAG: hypothetical protein M1819_002735 [Sarea resinae]
MGRYSSDPVWEDIVPLPQDDGGPNPLAAIAYPEDYSEAMSYLRAVMANNEFSDRTLELTEDIIDMNPAHYTVWLYRAKILLELKKDLREEIQWVNDVALRHLKNYQIWHHRQLIMDKLDDPTGERAFIAQMFTLDSKNHHVWTYRQWLVPRFSLWDSELPDIERLLEEDIRNNSAWNHRWFVVFGRAKLSKEKAASEQTETSEALETETLPSSIIDREITYAQNAILLAPQNQSPWNYLRGILRTTGRPLATQAAFAEQFASLDHPDEVRSSHALDLLADLYAEEAEGAEGGETGQEKGKAGEGNAESGKKKAEQALLLLAERYDPIRKGYWLWRRERLGLGEENMATVAAANA